MRKDGCGTLPVPKFPFPPFFFSTAVAGFFLIRDDGECARTLSFSLPFPFEALRNIASLFFFLSSCYFFSFLFFSPSSLS